jgi:predicted amidohydrolase YtcJ
VTTTPPISRRGLMGLLGSASVLAQSRPLLAQAVGLQDMGGAAAPLPEAVIYVAREIITMDPALPRAGAVAVVGDRIAAVGTVEELQGMAGDQPFRVDETFADKIMIAGFVEQHVHPVLAGLTMPSVVISIEPWDTATGFSEQARDEATYQTRLKEALAAHDKTQLFVTWGYHHYFHGPMDRAMLDALAPDFPVVIWHRSCHEFFLNTKVMEQFGIDDAFLATFTASEAAQSDMVTGHFFEQGAIKLLERLSPAVATPERLRKGLEFTVDYYHRNGITTCCEPGGFYSKTLQDAINAVYSADATPFNHYFIGDGKTFAATERDDPASMIAMAEAVLDWGEGRTRYLPKQIKFLTDGAIYSQLMQMRDGYTDGHEGAWIMDPDVFNYAFQNFWDAGYHIHVHNNGDAGMDVLLDNLEEAQRRTPRFDHRMTIAPIPITSPPLPAATMTSASGRNVPRAWSPSPMPRPPACRCRSIPTCRWRPPSPCSSFGRR